MPDPISFAAIIAKAATYLGLLATLGLTLCRRVFAAETDALGPQLAATTRRFACLGIGGACLGFLLGGAALTGQWRGMTDPTMLGLLWQTPPGTALALTLVGLALLAASAGQPPGWIALTGGALALAAFTEIGHVTLDKTPILAMALILHLVAIGFWIGILAPLTHLTRTAPAKAARLGQRFGQIALWVLPLLGLAGLAMAIALVRTPDALWSTGYGRTLLAKIAVVTGLLALGAANKTRHVPALARGDPNAPQRLTRSLNGEWVAFAATCLITAYLTTSHTVPA